MNRNILKLLLSAAFVMCCTFSALADDLGTPPDNEIWYTSNDGQVVTPYVTAFGGATIQSNEYDAVANKGRIIFNSNVTTIGAHTFENCSSLTSINLPSVLTNIGYQSFQGCTNLAEINIPHGVTIIDVYTFSGCAGLTEINIPNSVTSIGSGAFNGCTGLTGINIPNSVTSIGNSAFSGCTNLISIRLPNGLTRINNFVFQNCTGLTEINIPNGVTSIGGYAFLGCTSLTYMIVLAQNPPQLDTNVFYGIPANIPVYVPDKDVYSNTGKWKGYNFDFKNIDDNIFAYKQLSLREIHAALQGISLSDDETTAVNGHIQYINSVPDNAEATLENKAIIDNAKNVALAVIDLRIAKDTAIAEINAAMQEVTLSDDKTEVVNGYIQTIQDATTLEDVTTAKYAALAVIDLRIAKEAAIAEINDAMQEVTLSDDETTAVNGHIQTIQDATTLEDVITAKNAALAVINLRIAKDIAIAEINDAMQEVTLSDDETTAVNGHIQQIQDATTLEDVTTAKNAALAIISQAIIRNVREDALAALAAALQSVTSTYITNLAQQYIDIINSATDITVIDNARNTAVAVLNAAVGAYQAGKSEALGTMGTECTDCPAVKVTKGDKTVKLYNPEKVEFIKENGTPAVRVTRSDNSNETYLNPKKVDFGK